MRAQDVMTSPVTTARPDQTVKEVAALLASNGFTALPVVDDDGNVIGMMTEADALRDRVPIDARSRIWQDIDPQPQPAPPVTVLEAMSSPAVAVTPGTDTSQIARMMLDDHLRSVPVVDGHGIVGIITRRDLLRTIARDDKAILAAVRHRLSRYGSSDRWSVSVSDGVITILDDLDDATDRHVAQVIAESIPGVACVIVTSRRERIK